MIVLFLRLGNDDILRGQLGPKRVLVGVTSQSAILEKPGTLVIPQSPYSLLFLIPYFSYS